MPTTSINRKGEGGGRRQRCDIIRGIIRNFFEGTEENHDVTQGSDSPGRYLTSTIAQLIPWLVHGLDRGIVVLCISGRGKRLFSEVSR